MWKLMCFLLLPLAYYIDAGQGLKCYKCDSSENESCDGDLRANFYPEVCAAGEASCVTRLIRNPNGEQRIVRGCSDDSMCRGEACRQCYEDGCNTNIGCNECSRNNVFNCSGDTSEMLICLDGRDKCVATHLKGNEIIERKFWHNSTEYGEEEDSATSHFAIGTSFARIRKFLKMSIIALVSEI